MAGSEASAPKRARIDVSEDVRETSGCGAEGGAAAAAAVEGALSVHAVGDSPPPPVYPYASPSAAAVLLIGDGNLSFGAALVRQRGGGSGVIVTSFESHDELVGKYKETKGLIAELVAAGARVAHSVDATRLPQSLWDAGVDKDLRFDRVVFQFPLVPHAATQAEYQANPDPITTNRLMLRAFLIGSPALLRAPESEVHISSKDVKPYSWWKIQDLAPQHAGVQYSHRVPFDATLYPGYESRKPTNIHENKVESFPFTNCFTYIYTRPIEGAASEVVDDKKSRGPFYCALCEKQSTGAQNFEDHKRAKRHRLFAAIDGRWQTALAAVSNGE